MASTHTRTGYVQRFCSGCDDIGAHLLLRRVSTRVWSTCSAHDSILDRNECNCRHCSLRRLREALFDLLWNREHILELNCHRETCSTILWLDWTITVGCCHADLTRRVFLSWDAKLSWSRQRRRRTLILISECLSSNVISFLLWKIVLYSTLTIGSSSRSIAKSLILKK